MERQKDRQTRKETLGETETDTDTERNRARDRGRDRHKRGHLKRQRQRMRQSKEPDTLNKRETNGDSLRDGRKKIIKTQKETIRGTEGETNSEAQIRSKETNRKRYTATHRKRQRETDYNHSDNL